MYRGHLVEVQDAHRLYRAPQDTYTRALLSAVPVPDPSVRRERLPWDSGACALRRAARLARAQSGQTQAGGR